MDTAINYQKRLVYSGIFTQGLLFRGGPLYEQSSPKSLAGGLNQPVKSGLDKPQT